jgi:hypothetical protein
MGTDVVPSEHAAVQTPSASTAGTNAHLLKFHVILRPLEELGGIAPAGLRHPFFGGLAVSGERPVGFADRPRGRGAIVGRSDTMNFNDRDPAGSAAARAGRNGSAP